MKRLLAGTLAVAASLAITASAQAAPQSFYFNCGGQTPLTNLTAPPATWSATAPSAAFPQGGCVTAMYEVGTATFGGTYAGEVRKMDLTVYGVFSNPLYRTVIGSVDFNISITADGDEIYTGDTVAMTTEAAGVPGGFKASLSIPDLNLHAKSNARTYEITISDPYVDDQYFLGRGASDLASGVKFYAWDDLTPEEQQTILCEQDPTQCPDDGE